jgi:RNA polymerase sigma-70 factor (ECF subfamily)
VEFLPEPRSSGPSIADRVADQLDVDAAMQQLSPDHRAAVALRDLVGLDYAEIGEVLGIPPGTVRSRIARGRAALADHLAERDAGNQTGGSEHPTSRAP